MFKYIAWHFGNNFASYASEHVWMDCFAFNIGESRFVVNLSIPILLIYFCYNIFSNHSKRIRIQFWKITDCRLVENTIYMLSLSHIISVEI